MIKLFFGKFIHALAQSAVIYAQNVLSSQRGEEKKNVAIAYVMDKLPICTVFKPIVYRFIADIIDEAIELAVVKLKG